MKILSLRNFLNIILVGVLIASSSDGLHAQDYTDNNNGEPLFWDEDAQTPSVYLENGIFSFTPDGLNTLGYINNVNYDYAFSSLPPAVGTEAQTILLDSNNVHGLMYVMGGLYFNQGSISLLDDPKNPGSSFLIGDDGITLTEGTGDATISPTTLYVYDDEDSPEYWNNNSSANLTVNGTIEGAYGSSSLTFAGTGTGSVYINARIAANLGIDQESATSTLYLSNINNTGLTSLVIDRGTVVAVDSAKEAQYNYANVGSTNGLPILIENGGTLTFTNNTIMAERLIVTGGGTLNFVGDTDLNWAGDAVTADTLTFGSGDILDYTGFDFTNYSTHSVDQDIATLDLNSGSSYGRLLLGYGGQGFGLIAGTTVNIFSGYNLDFASGGTPDNVINVASGAQISARNGVTVYLGANTILPTSGGKVTLGSDDYDTGTPSSLVFTAPQTLTGTFEIDLNSQATDASVTFSNTLSGPGGLSVGAGSNSKPFIQTPLYLPGTNTYSGPTTLIDNGSGYAPFVDITGDSSGIGTAINIEDGTLAVGPGGVLPTTAVISIGSSTNDTADFQIGDANGAANVTVGEIIAASNVGNGNWLPDQIIGGNASVSNLTVDVVSGADVYNGILLDGAQYNYNAPSTDLPLSLTKTGAGTLYLTNTNSNYSGGTFIDEGTLGIYTGGYTGVSAVGAGPITINNAATLDLLNSGLQSSVILGTPGTLTDAGVTYSVAGQIEGNGDTVIDTPFAGGGGVAIVGGDIIPELNAVSTPGAIVILHSRLLLYNNLDFVSGATSVTAADGGIFDIGTGGTVILDTPVYMGNGGALEDRQTNVTVTDLKIAPPVTSGGTTQFDIGSDDYIDGAITIQNSVALNQNVEVDGIERDGRFTSVNFAGGFSGTGNLTFGSAFAYGYADQNRGVIDVSGANTYTGDTTVNSGLLDLTGDNTGVHSAGGGAPNYFITTSSPTYSITDPATKITTNYTAFEQGTLQIGTGGSLASDANIVSSGGTVIFGDANGAISQTIGGLSTTPGSTGDTIYNGNTGSSANSSLTVDLASGTDTYAGTIGNNSAANGNNLSLTKSGAGTLALDGANTYTGGTTVAGGRLAVNGSITGNAVVNAGAEIGGSGYVAGTISGAGAVGPGNSPGILTAGQVDPTGGLNFNFELTQAGDPTYGAASASGNDVLHLISTTPFVAPLTLLRNTVSVYFSGNGTFDGGFFVDGSADSATNIADGAAFVADVTGADYIYYVLDGAGSYLYNGHHYALASTVDGTVSMTTMDVTGAAFADGTVDGYQQQFVLVGADVPEPSTYTLMLGGLVLLGLGVRRKLALSSRRASFAARRP
jgi:fibronectin-binding autotransporter adhesin